MHLFIRLDVRSGLVYCQRLPCRIVRVVVESRNYGDQDGEEGRWNRVYSRIRVYSLSIEEVRLSNAAPLEYLRREESLCLYMSKRVSS